MGSITNSVAATGCDSLHVVMIPYLAFGHISPFIQLARKLVSVSKADNSCSVVITILSAPANVARIASLIPPCPSIRLQSLPLLQIPGLPQGIESTAELTASQAEVLKLAIDLMKPDVESLLKRLKPNLVVFDFSQPWVPSIAAPLGIKSLFFSVFAAVSTAYLTVPSRRPPGPTQTVGDLKRPPAGFPATSALATGVPTYQAADFTYMFKEFDGPCVYDRVVKCLRDCSAIIAKTCNEMEGQYISYVESEYKKQMLLAGPVVPEPPSGELEERWANWLDRFDEGLVIYSSFGSETFLSDDGMTELLLGLEMTQLPFFVVLNSPEGEEAMRKKLPSGFEERVKERGVIHHGWVQQQLILRHRSVGCFVCHAGFSSIIEGVVAGCRIVMIPQRGDQYLNSVVFVKDLGVGVEVRREEESGRFVREDICDSVWKVMDEEKEEGKNVREKHRKWRQFFMDKVVEERFMAEFVKRLRALAK